MNLEQVRADFPILEQEVNGKPLVYLDNAASAQKPQAVMDAMTQYFRETHSNVHRGAHSLGDRATALFEGARETVRSQINAASANEIIWTRGTTEGINLVANGFYRSLKQGDEILVSRMEHHANIVPWQMLAEATGASLKVIEVTPEGELDQQSFRDQLSERTKVFAITAVSNVLGTINPTREMVAAAKEAGAYTLVDGAQAIPHLGADVQALDCDFYVFSGHKLFGPTGIGVLYGRENLLNEWPVYQTGGEMIHRVSFEGTSFQKTPYRFEAGTPAIAEAIGLATAMRYLDDLGHDGLREAEAALGRRVDEWVADFPGLTRYGQAENKVPVLSFWLEGLHPSDLGTLLDQQGIAIRTGHHCCMPLMEHFGIAGTARASFAFYNTVEEVDTFFQGLQRIQRLFTGK
ncbi:SufS family cysteine desulfurase [uncultured Halovibrio sp.]|uniref:aminotransferase class V-fold PLP-dependent enzyme n=1 Tax=uncultured Halovibrio sp. TaxID=985049 RepID=UPI0025E06632|nr:SufS family cysteine desulfurase [uncultured Halovibrio sp.]